jgi:predicted transcriptional regulator
MDEPKEKLVRVSVDMTPALREQLRQLAKARDTKIAGIVRTAIRDYLARCEAQPDAPKRPPAG